MADQIPPRSSFRPAAAGPACSGAPRILRILAVDDEPAVREILEAYLRMEGHVVQTAAEADAGLRLFEGGDWDLVLTDRSMPGMNGEEFAERIKYLSPQTPVIMVTGMELPAGRQPGGAIDWVVRKPFTREMLREAIAQVVFAEPERARTSVTRASSASDSARGAIAA